MAGAASAAIPSGSVNESGTPSTRTRTSSDQIVKAAVAAAVAHAKETGVGKKESLTAKDTMIDPEGKRHVRFARVYDGVPVVGGDIVVHLDRHNTYLDVTRAIGHQVSVATLTPRLTAEQAADRAAASVNGSVDGTGGAGAEAAAKASPHGPADTAELVIDARGAEPVLAYQVTVVDVGAPEAGGRSVIVDATSGKVLSSSPLAEGFISPKLERTLRGLGSRALAPLAAPKAAAPGKAGTGNSLFVGRVPLTTTKKSGSGAFVLTDPSRGSSETRSAQQKRLDSFQDGKTVTDADNRWGNGKVSDPVTAAVDVQYGITTTFDFYKSTFGRKGTKNDGKGPQAMVHWGSKVANAFWSGDCGCMLYGDGDGQQFKQPLVALDVTGHELTHGVVEATANLKPTRIDANGNQFGEPGSLNESLADIFASSVEFKANNPANPPNYLLGEKLGLAQKFLRRLDKPSLDKLEGSVDYWDKGSFDREVHAGSGVSSHAYYLLAEGSGKKTIRGVAYDSPTFDGSKVKGIGRAKAEQIFYRALTRYMVSTTDFHQARVATLKAAADIHGSGSTEYQAVNRAWAAVNVTEANTPGTDRH
ncbi:M4 family metallopeptidase [Wenjunlia tyrosinilytica]|nr:M4 family metallopeptidase [Wenjunlia tyrosinilytica]